MIRSGVLAVLLVLAAPSAASAAAAPVGFQLDLVDGQHIECSLSPKRLDCLNYTVTPSGTCDAGGAVYGVSLTTKATTIKPRTYCVDEGYHGWPRLRDGKTWNRGGFKCRVRKDGTALSCANATGKHVMFEVQTTT